MALWNCSEQRDTVSVSAHPDGWSEISSPDFHGNMVKDSQSGYENCVTCHGDDYQGGTSGVSCYKCHTSYPHPMEWIMPGSGDFHGTAVLNSTNKAQDCQACHGDDYNGGSSEKSCYTCHSLYPHPSGFANPASDSFHTSIMPEILWNIRTGCISCHGDDYKGKGYADKNCTSCHLQANGPEACNTCHGNEDNIAPPADRWGDTDISQITVGVHQKHLTDTSLTTVVMEAGCTTCHPNVSNFDDAGHLDETINDPADIAFSDLAKANNANPIWDRSTGTCSGVSCHGGFTFRKDESQSALAAFIYADSVIVGHDSTMSWTNTPADPEVDNCSGCHALPPKGHAPLSTCSSCHPTVDASNNIIDKKAHINGQINAN